MLRVPPRSPLFPYTTALPILLVAAEIFAFSLGGAVGEGVTLALGAVAGTAAFLVASGILNLGVVVDGRSPWWRTWRSEEHTSELQSRRDLVCRLLLEKKIARILTLLVILTMPLFLARLPLIPIKSLSICFRVI